MLERLRKIFNNLFKESTKDFLRKKMEPLFFRVTQIMDYNSYIRVAKKVVKNIVFDKDYLPYKESFLQDIKKEFIKTEVVNYYSNTDDEEIKKYLEYIKKHGIDVYCSEFMHENIYGISDVFYDDEHMLFYGVWNGKKLYFKRGISSLNDALNSLNVLAMEQKPDSPHRYITSEFDVESDDIVFDIGCAEGNFSLDIVEKAKKIYLFEADPKWIEALELTFAPYKEKVVIVPRYVSDKDDVMSVKLDTFCKENAIPAIDFLKMDVEGYESKVIKGAWNLVKNSNVKKIAVTTYHNIEDEVAIGNLLSNYEKELSKGYMLGSCIYEVNNIKKPFFVRGIMRAKIKQDLQ